MFIALSFVFTGWQRRPDAHRQQHGLPHSRWVLYSIQLILIEIRELWCNFRFNCFIFRFVRSSRSGILGRRMCPGQSTRCVLPSEQIPELGGQPHDWRLSVYERLHSVGIIFISNSCSCSVIVVLTHSSLLAVPLHTMSSQTFYLDLT